MKIFLQCYNAGCYDSWTQAENNGAVYETDVTVFEPLLGAVNGLNSLLSVSRLGAVCLDGDAPKNLKYRLVTYP